MTIKTCSCCKKEKLLSEFRKDKTKPSGYQSRCKICAREQSNAHYAKYKDSILKRNNSRAREMKQRLNEYKAEQKCTICNEEEVVCLDFHHIDPSTKELQLSRVTTESWETIMNEVSKCVVVCKNCHAKIHAGLITI